MVTNHVSKFTLHCLLLVALEVQKFDNDYDVIFMCYRINVI